MNTADDVFAHRPFLVLWEMTRACALACRHCRAEALTKPAADELTHAESRALLEHIADAFGPTLVVCTGGDPFQRADLEALIAYGTELGLRMALTPSATALCTQERLSACVAAGVKRIALSLDGIDAVTHDGFRGVHGTFDRTLAALQWCQELGVESQVNSSIGRHNVQHLDDFAELLAFYDVRLWSVFLLVATGRAVEDMLASAAEHERIYRRLAALATTVPFDIKTTAGQPYYRVRAQAMGLSSPTADVVRTMGLRSPSSVNDGKGVVFVGHDGSVQPSGFLAEVIGNVRECSLAELYRHHALMRALRDPQQLAGKCGYCSFNRLCGGSRSRSWSLTGDPLAADPTCVYQPKVTNAKAVNKATSVSPTAMAPAGGATSRTQT